MKKQQISDAEQKKTTKEKDKEQVVNKNEHVNEGRKLGQKKRRLAWLS